MGFCSKLVTDFNILEAFCELAAQPHTLFLDSSDPAHPDARYSFLMWDPVETLTLKDEDAPFKTLQTLFIRYQDHYQTDDCPFPFCGGLAGLFSYDLGRSLETLPEENTGNAFPDIALGVYDKFLCHDHDADQLHLCWYGGEPAPSLRANKMSEAIQNLDCFVANAPRNDETQDSFQSKIQNVIDYIYAGDIFQANLSQLFKTDLPKNFDIAAQYLRLRKSSPSPFSAFVNLGNEQVLSSSPERFLRVDHTGKVETKPIKGTAPRYKNKAQDNTSKEILMNSAKDRAENTMIVDLLRNDLSKCCGAKNLHVEKLCELESFEHVHHLVSTVTGQLQENKNALDLLEGCFPGGSITGAPKIRAMEIIEELETSRRGPYCGSIGYIGFDGAMDTNILIRTLVIEGQKAWFRAGGGIVADSVPTSEYQETLDKAQGILKSFRR